MLHQSDTPPLSRWWTVVAGIAGCALGAGVLVIYTFGVFAAAMATELGWSRTVHANSLTVFLVSSGFGSLLLGPLIDRFGVRRPCAALVTIFGLSVACLALIPTSRSVVYLIFAVIGLSGSAATAMPYAVAVRSLFDRERGLALGLVNLGSGIGSATAPYIASTLLNSLGWRGGYLCVGVSAVIPVLGLLRLVTEPDRAPLLQSTTEPERPRVWDQLLRPTFWLIAVPIAGISIATFGVLGSMVPLLKDRGVAATSIAAIMSSAGVSSWLARPVVGYALDRFFGPFVTAATFVLAVLGLMLLMVTDSAPGTVAAAVLVGFALGSEGDLLTFLVSRYYGAGIYSRVLGTFWVAWSWGGGIGTFLSGASYGIFASYTPALAAFSVLLCLCTLTICRLGPYEYPALAEDPRRFSPARVRG